MSHALVLLESTWSESPVTLLHSSPPPLSFFLSGLLVLAHIVSLSSISAALFKEVFWRRAFALSQTVRNAKYCFLQKAVPAFAENPHFTTSIKPSHTLWLYLQFKTLTASRHNYSPLRALSPKFKVNITCTLNSQYFKVTLNSFVLCLKTDRQFHVCFWSSICKLRLLQNIC